MHTVYTQMTVFNFSLEENDGVHFKKTFSAAIHDLRESGQTEGIDTELFYNRSEETNDTIKRYPLIQFKPVKGKAALLAINEGINAVNEILALLNKEENKHIKNKFLRTKQNYVDLSEYKSFPLEKHTIKLLTIKQQYRVINWLPLDSHRYKVFLASGELKVLAELLDECLSRQINTMIAGTGFRYNFPFITYVSSILATKKLIQVYKEKKLPFDCTFFCNLHIPDGIGIGQVPGIGFGTVYRT
ncbi:MAG: hypothetical protein LC128_10230 [Chitinophagales bacterium]|nr:hypothetical protein [Chitinophagales bacterium]